MKLPYRIGQGYDVHALTPGRKLILGGVRDSASAGPARAFRCRRAAACDHRCHPRRGRPGRHRRHVSRHRRAVGGRRQPDTAARGHGGGARRRLAGGQRRRHDHRPGAAHRAACRRDARQHRGRPRHRSAEAVNVKGKTNERLGFRGARRRHRHQAVVLLVRADNLNGRSRARIGSSLRSGPTPRRCRTWPRWRTCPGDARRPGDASGVAAPDAGLHRLGDTGPTSAACKKSPAGFAPIPSI
jgi:2-C-methyl-D-erythritol 2,4-cyclodiphosphate synthase